MKPVWTSSTFLQYAGMLIVVVAVAWLLSFLQDQHGSGGLVGWAALFLAVALGLALSVLRRGEPLLAGLLALLAVIVFAAFAGAIFDVLGLVDEEDGGPLAEGFDFWLIVLELLVLFAALAALRRFRFPLLALVAAVAAWVALVDVVGEIFGGGNDAHAATAILIGLGFVAAGRSMDAGGHSTSAFWVHLVGGLSLGGGVLWFLHSEDWHWAIVGIVALVYVAAARTLLRSSYAVLGAIGMTAVASYFIEQWFSLSSLVPFFGVPLEETDDAWGRPLLYLVLGAVLVALGLWVQWRRTPFGAEREAGPAP